MRTFILKCRNGTQFRLGAGSKNEVSRHIHSDTIFSALVNIYSLIHDDTDEFIRLAVNGDISISSAFPCLENLRTGKYIYFLPVPVMISGKRTDEGGKSKDGKDESKNDIKILRKIKYISREIFDDLSRNFNNEEILSYADFPETDYIFPGSIFALKKSELDAQGTEPDNITFFSEHTAPKVNVSSKSKKDTFYYETNIALKTVYGSDGKPLLAPHYYILTDYKNEEAGKKLMTAIRVLADEGIGGERSSGKGLFEKVDENENMIFDGAGNCYISLSLTCPANDDEFHSAKRYDIIKRGGGDLGTSGESEYHRKQINMMSEGSLFSKPVKGMIADVSPDAGNFSHKIYRNGKCMCIPFGGQHE